LERLLGGLYQPMLTGAAQRLRRRRSRAAPPPSVSPEHR
jgi:hypothetical protein